MKTLADLRVGDQVWIGDVNSRRAPSTAVVEKVGRKLLTVSGLQFRLDTGYRNDGYSHRWIIPDLHEYRERNERDRLWAEIRRHSLPSDVALADLREAARLLRINATKDQE